MKSVIDHLFTFICVILYILRNIDIGNKSAMGVGFSFELSFSYIETASCLHEKENINYPNGIS